jgi:hypothetical protein
VLKLARDIQFRWTYLWRNGRKGRKLPWAYEMTNIVQKIVKVPFKIDALCLHVGL